MSVQQKKVVDLVTYDSTEDSYVLIMIEERPWRSDDQLLELKDKLNSYLSFVLDLEFSVSVLS